MYLKESYYRLEKAGSTSISTIPPTDPESGYRLSGGFFSLEAGLVFLGSLENSQPRVGRKPVALETGDFNGDRIQDIAIAFNAVRVNFIRIFYGNGDGLKSLGRIEGGG